MAIATGWWEPAIDEWRRNLRLRLGVLALVVILAGYGLLALADQLKPLRAEHQRLRQQLVNVRNLAEQRFWEDRLTAARALRVQMESRLWRADSRGLANADVQNWINAQLKTAQITPTRVQVEPARELTDHPGLWEVTARLDAPLALENLRELLRLIEGDSRLTVVERLEALPGNPPRFLLGMKAYFQDLP
ncbi:MAG: hypothetical protein IT491_08500 [Gammaproteobacteria bacterium]|nr:hypothetical protein [Gammaproteobacteria bacterium]